MIDGSVSQYSYDNTNYVGIILGLLVIIVSSIYLFRILFFLKTESNIESTIKVRDSNFFCHNCGAESEKNAKFCSKCGINM
ncbi:MAG: zinc ribbon domain-containing protein [Candidatus Doudnabacteria bacterium]